MAGIRDINTIDLVGTDADGEVILAIVEDAAWTDDASTLDDLREKFNTYATYVAGGQLVEMYPDFADRPVRIQIDCPEAPTGAVAQLIELTVPLLGDYGIRLVVNARGW